MKKIFSLAIYRWFFSFYTVKKIGRPILANLPTYYVPFQSLNAQPTYLPKIGTSLLDVPQLADQKSLKTPVRNIKMVLKWGSHFIGKLLKCLKFNQFSTNSCKKKEPNILFPILVSFFFSLVSSKSDSQLHLPFEL